MKKLSLLTAALCAVAVTVQASASAKILELGAPLTAVSAPPPCTTSGTTTTCPHGVNVNSYGIVQTRITAIQTLADGRANPTVAPAPGRIVAFTVGLSALDTNLATRKSEIHYEDSTYHGPTQVQLTVLRRVGKASNNTWKVVAQSPPVHVQPYLGMVVQFPLETTLPVQQGDLVALTTPTWAPVLSLFQNPKKFAYRQSRRANCPNPPATQQAQLTIGQSTQYLCSYPGTRAEYSATEVTTTPYPKNYVRAPDILGAVAKAAPSPALSISGGAPLL